MTYWEILGNSFLRLRKKNALLPFDSSRGFSEDGNTLDSILNILITVLRLLIFR